MTKQDQEKEKNNEELQADLAWLRRQRLATEDIAMWIRRGVITTVISGVLYLLWEGLKLAFQ